MFWDKRRNWREKSDNSGSGQLMFTEHLLCEPPWTSTDDNISSIYRGFNVGQRLGSSLYSLNNPMRQRLSIPIS